MRKAVKAKPKKQYGTEAKKPNYKRVKVEKEKGRIKLEEYFIPYEEIV